MSFYLVFLSLLGVIGLTIFTVVLLAFVTMHLSNKVRW